MTDKLARRRIVILYTVEEGRGSLNPRKYLALSYPEIESELHDKEHVMAQLKASAVLKIVEHFKDSEDSKNLAPAPMDVLEFRKEGDDKWKLISKMSLIEYQKSMP